MYVVKHRTFFFWLTGLILGASIAALAAWGLPLGIEFTGGVSMQVEYQEGRPSIDAMEGAVREIVPHGATIRAIGENGVNVRAREMSDLEHQGILVALESLGSSEEVAFTSIGPALGSQFTAKALWAIFAVVVAIVLYIAFAFRKVSRPVPSWGYGLTTVAMLLIDLIVPAGFYAAYAHFTGAEVDSLFVVAILALLGYVVNDVIVVFDRVREHLAHNEKEEIEEPFEHTVGKSIDETMARSINTAVTVVLVLLALLYLGAPATRNFALLMLVGVVVGAFSSIARSAPLLIPLAKRFSK